MEKLVIWDLDGTLVNSLPVTFDAFNDGIEPHLGRRLTPEEIIRHFGPSERHVIAKLVGEKHAEDAYSKVVASMVARLHEIKPFEGILETLAKLSDSDYRLAIFTGRGREGTDTILGHLKLNSLFGTILTNSEVKNAKPHPEGIIRICEEMDIHPDNAVMVGDSPMDVQAGRSAGVRTVGCTWDLLTDRAQLSGAAPHYLINHPTELTDWLEATQD